MRYACIAATMLSLGTLPSPLWVGRFASTGPPPAPWRVVQLNKTTNPRNIGLPWFGESPL
jgi:hypothetical protein